MVTVTGKFNECKVFTDYVDDTTLSQLSLLLDQEFVADSKIRIMPDTHAGTGCVIGTTMTLTNKVVPNLVGVDIGCGMLAVKLKENSIDLNMLDTIIRNYVPSGFDIHEKPIAYSDIDKIFAPVNLDRAYQSLGTLGGGNHFIEVDKDKDDNLWLVIHTGSRHLGIEVCKCYQNMAFSTIHKKNTSEKIEEIVARLKSEGKQKDIEKTLIAFKKNSISIPKDLSYLEGENFFRYIHDMKYTQEHAKINREIIAKEILNHMNLHEVERFDTIHNYIDTENMILRKGSISAQKNEKVIIPMNMRDGSLICVGKGNPDWNYSAPHGAGRLLSRIQAKEKLSLDEFEKSMNGIFSTCVGIDTIDESPMAYKPMDEIVKNITDTVDIIDVIKPIYNFKAN